MTAITLELIYEVETTGLDSKGQNKCLLCAQGAMLCLLREA